MPARAGRGTGATSRGRHVITAHGKAVVGLRRGGGRMMMGQARWG
jgi:hypothetical protein